MRVCACTSQRQAFVSCAAAAAAAKAGRPAHPPPNPPQTKHKPKQPPKTHQKTNKARDIFEPYLHQLGYRLAHVLRRLLPVAMFLLQRDGVCLSGHDLFLKRVGASYHAFIDEVRDDCGFVV